MASPPERTLSHPFGQPVPWDTRAEVVAQSKGRSRERHDADAGLQSLNARTYDPLLGLFLQPDWFEVTDPGVGTNRYSYSFNDPVNRLDPKGNKSSSPEDDKESAKRKKDREEAAKQVRTVGLGKWMGKALKELSAAQAARQLKYARALAVDLAWKMERNAVANGFPGSREWNDTQRAQLLKEGRVSGFEGHHMNTVNGNIDLAVDPGNIEFLTKAEHDLKHRLAGGYKAPISEQARIDRTFGGQLPDLSTEFSRSWGDRLTDFGYSAVGVIGSGLMVLDYADPVFGPMGILNGDGLGCQTLDCP